MSDPQITTPTEAINDNAATPAAAVKISFSDLAKGLNRDEDDLLMQLAEIFSKRGTADAE